MTRITDHEPTGSGVFVRVDLLTGISGGVDPVRCWGIYDATHEELLPVYSTDMDFVNAEMGFDNKANGLTNDEIATVVVAEDDPETPDEAWAALARRRLTE